MVVIIIIIIIIIIVILLIFITEWLIRFETKGKTKNNSVISLRNSYAVPFETDNNLIRNRKPYDLKWKIIWFKTIKL